MLARNLVPEGCEAYTRFGSVLEGGGGGVLWVGSEWAGGERGAVWRVEMGWVGGVGGVEGQRVLGGKEVGEVKVAVWGGEVGGRFARSLRGGGGRGLVVGEPGRGGAGGRVVGGVVAFEGE